MAEELGIKNKKEENLIEWFNEVILKAGLADYSKVKGCMILLPYGYAIWENIQKIFDNMIKEDVKNVYFPLFIPKSLLEKEEKHFEGFKAEVAWVKSEEKEEQIAIRPTSETIIYSYFAEKKLSYRDLPIKINQWCNVVRWETKTTRLFLRTREFLWQEGHCIFSNKEDCDKEVLKRLNQYKELIEKYLAIAVIAGYKSENEKFAGALYTTTLEAMMPDGKALQCATSHNLGTNFSKAFDFKYLDKDNQWKYVWICSWGLSWRLIGAIVMVHGDNKGLVLPPKIAPIQIVIVPIYYEEKDKKRVLRKCKSLYKKLSKKFRVYLDDREQYTPGYKFNDWELKGVPIRIEIGLKEIESKKITVFRRDLMERKEIEEKELVNYLNNLIEEIHSNLYNKSKKFLEENIVKVENYEEFKKTIESKKFVFANFCGSIEEEEKIKNETQATIRVIPFDSKPFGNKKCIYCGKEAKYAAYFAKSY